MFWRSRFGAAASGSRFARRYPATKLLAVHAQFYAARPIANTRARGVVGPRHDATTATAPAHRRKAPAVDPRVARAAHSSRAPRIPQSAARSTLAADAALVGGAAAALATARAAVDAAARAHARQRPPAVGGGGAAAERRQARAARGADEDVRAERLASPPTPRPCCATRRRWSTSTPRPLPEAAREAAVDPLRRVGRGARELRGRLDALWRAAAPPRARPATADALEALGVGRGHVLTEGDDKAPR